MKLNFEKILNLDEGKFLLKYVPFLEEITVIINESNRYYSENKERGVEFIANSELEVDSIIFHRDGHDGYKGYNLRLPHLNGFNHNIDEVHEILGNPFKVNQEIPLIGVPFNELYNFTNYNFGVFYSNDKMSLNYCQIIIT
ncbi:MAG: hypothetical protein OCD76_08480 [Reichenbachiella sp.]